MPLFRYRRLRPEGPTPALIAAGVCAAGLAMTGLIAFLVPVAHAGDASSLQGFAALSARPRLTRLATFVAHLGDALPYALGASALVGVALVRRQRRLALVLAGVLTAAAVTSELLKPLLADPARGESFGDFSVGGASWPSGHATAAMALALGAVLVSPQRLRPLVAAAGSALAVGVGFSVLMLGWHFPSDILGGYLVAATWVALGVAALRAERPPPSPLLVGPSPAAARRRAALVPVLTVAVAAWGVATAIVLRPDALASFASTHGSLLAGAFAIAALAWTLASSLALALRS